MRKYYESVFIEFLSGIEGFKDSRVQVKNKNSVGLVPILRGNADHTAGTCKGAFE
jgi:hypothetical protein